MSPDRLRTIDARRIAIIKPSSLGDIVQALPLLPVLRERFPAARISWIVRDSLAELLEGHPQLDEIIRWQRRGGWRGWRRLLGTLWRRRFDLVFDLQGLLRSGVMTLATRAALRVGLETAREGSGWTSHLLLSDSGHTVPAHERYWRVAEALGLGDRRRQTIVPFSAHDVGWSRKQLAATRRPLVAIHPGSRWPTKRWPVQSFAAVGRQAITAHRASIVLVGDASELPLTIQLEHLLRRDLPNARVVNLAGRTSLKQLAAVLCDADVLLTNDSGPMHLAAGLGTLVLGVFLCTSPERSGPLGQHVTVVTTVSCAASYHKRCPYSGPDHLACLRDVTPERVIAALEELVQPARFAA